MATKTLTNSGATFSSSVKKIGSYSVNFNTTYFYVPGGVGGNADFDFGTGDFTIEMWFYSTATNASKSLVTYGDNGGGRAGWITLYDSSGITFAGSSNGTAFDISNITTSGVTFSQNTWYHLAIVRNGTSFKIYIDGTERANGTSSSSIFVPSAINGSYYYNNVNFGVIYYPVNTWGTGPYGFVGYQDEIRISKGIARYTSNFTPSTTPFTGDANTSLLLHLENNLTDNSADSGATVNSNFLNFFK